ncbi:hypothetical protein TL16_g05629 [Triparma laevis f. inornata]|uniref:RING-type domain-containing protein n=1 Tax=Triparma laevis f. inornata TaxID=1714386 RepID=A0A9W7AFJ7_9STRA|nr:hypothetical protein TL16_g05629 [Triparma laevis f. inornata]
MLLGSLVGAGLSFYRSGGRFGPTLHGASNGAILGSLVGTILEMLEPEPPSDQPNPNAMNLEGIEYSDLLRLFPGPTPQPASSSLVDNLPTEKITLSTSKGGGSCSICLEDFSVNEYAKRLPCLHLFHKECVDSK